MKKLLSLLFVGLFFLVGCNGANSPLEPVSNSTDQTTNNDPKIIRSRTFTIDGDKGGLIYEKYMWKEGSFDSLKVEAKLKIPAGAFKDSLTFDIIIDPNLLSIQLYPSPFTFDKPVLLDLKYKGVDFSKIDTTNLTFNYIAPDGELIETNYESIQIDPVDGVLFVHDAKLPHFSRYGWLR